MAELHIIATLVSKVDKADALRDLMLSVVPRFREEDGCLAYALLEDQNRPGRFMTHEQWRDADALTVHMSSPAMKDAKPKLADLLDGSLEQISLDPWLVL